MHGYYYSFIRSHSNAVFGKSSFNSFWRILQNENYKYWREDLRGSLAHELLNGGLLREIFKRLFDHVLFSAMRVSQPSISGLHECLQSQPTQISILEKYIEWIHQFAGETHKQVLLHTNANYKFTFSQFLEQANIFRQNLQ